MRKLPGMNQGWGLGRGGAGATGASLRAALVALFVTAAASPALDRNGNQQSDLWEMQHQATGLTASADADGDLVSNRDESTAGTDPRDPASFPEVGLGGANGLQPTWAGLPGKRYEVQMAPDLGSSWQVVTTYTGSGQFPLEALTNAQVVRINIRDVDTDGDALNDWEELHIGFDPESSHTERYSSTDSQRVAVALTTMSTVTVSLVDGEISERWPDAGVVAVRRSGGIMPLTVNFSLGGTATRDVDYTAAPGLTVALPAGRREVWLSFMPVADADDAEEAETIVVTLATGSNYVLGTASAATVNLANEAAGSPPSSKAAARFLVQAAFGPDADAADDEDMVPENVEEVVSLGFAGWLDQQFARPATALRPFVDWADDTNNITEFYTDRKEAAWWYRAMGVTNLYPGGPAVEPDPLRQRMAFALSEIFVISDRLEALGSSPEGMAHYYDMLLTNSFGNFRQLLYDVTVHPCMGLYLSHLKNRKPDLANNLFPDENYAREVMQLFTIGLWELNQDGTRRLDTNGLAIPTYDNDDISAFARVFTGLSYGGTNANSFLNAPVNLLSPMKMWDTYHDLDAKELLNGQVLAARVASNPNTGAAGLADLNAALDNLFWHTNTAPFIGRQLIQRFVTSNPSTGYVARVAASFNDNGQGGRGDLQAVLRAILLDEEARDPLYMSQPAFGKQREPFLRVVNFARAFNAYSYSGLYPLDTFYMDHYQEPLKSLSVFNFFQPGYAPPGPLTDLGLSGPEFQILHAGSAISGPNYYYNAIRNSSLHRYGNANSNRVVRLEMTQELSLATNNVDALVRRLDLGLTCGTLEPATFQVVRENVERIGASVSSSWPRERVNMAIYLIVTSPEFSVMR